MAHLHSRSCQQRAKGNHRGSKKANYFCTHRIQNCTDEGKNGDLVESWELSEWRQDNRTELWFKPFSERNKCQNGKWNSHSGLDFQNYQNSLLKIEARNFWGSSTVMSNVAVEFVFSGCLSARSWFRFLPTLKWEPVLNLYNVSTRRKKELKIS